MKYEVFADDFYIDKKYIGIGCLFVPESKKLELVNSLINMRCMGKSDIFTWNFKDCPFHTSCREDYHRNNNCEIHYRRLSNSSSHSKQNISKEWIKFLINNNLNNKGLVYFKILYINLSNLDKTVFGEEGIHENIYNRFFRTLIKGSRFFFGNGLKEISRIYHDNGENHENHPYFPWHVGSRLNMDEEDFNVINEEIQFVDSDHKSYFDRNEKLVYESQLIQFIDLIMGTVSRNIFEKLSNDSFKISLAEMMNPLVERLLKSPNNPYSRYNYYQKQSVDFFPKKKVQHLSLLGELVEEKCTGFYKVKKTVKLPRCTQGPLDKWLK
ncbi:MAG: hypothetical protein QME14_09880 [Methanobacteriaceae archaeon]|nr:hypothetical protein [Methanobacteriaceae archaeon]